MDRLWSGLRAATLVTLIAAATPACANYDLIDVEVIPSDEPENVRANTELTIKLQEKRKKFPNQLGQVLRGVHPKSHGCVNATFTVVEGIDERFRRGLFRKPASFVAKIRYSNASVLKLEDLRDGNGSRGMAIKILGVDGPILLNDGKERNQDYLMINTPAFAFANVRDYLRLTRVLMANDFGADPGPYFAPLRLLKAGLLTGEFELKSRTGNEPVQVAKDWVFFEKNSQAGGAFHGFGKLDFKGTMQSRAVIQSIRSMPVRNPLQVSYFGAAPSRYGGNNVMKFFVEPVEKTPQLPFTVNWH